MSRPTFRQNPTLESLERREVLSGPSADAQYMLELVNLARTSPARAAERISNTLDANDVATIDYYNVDLQSELRDIANSAPTQPLAWSDPLAAAATGQSADQANTGQQSHTGADGSNLDTRIARTGLTQVKNVGENAFAYSKSVDEAMKAFLVDWGVDSKGHRKTLLQQGVDKSSTYNEIGIGIVGASKNGLGPLVITQNFARRDTAKPYLLGVVYDDPTNTKFYAPGKGRGGVEIQAANLFTGNVVTTQTMDAGGYQVNLDPGSYRVTAKINGAAVQSKDVYVGNENVKVDFNLNDGTPVLAAPVPTTPAPVTPATPKPPVVTFATQAVQQSTPVYQAPRPRPTPVPTPTVSYQVEQTANSDDVPSPVLAASAKSAALTSPLFNPLGWISNWTSWKATNTTSLIRR